MDSVNSELYRIAGYSQPYIPTLSDHEHIFPENIESEVSTGYSCIFNWANMRYTFVSDSIKKILGYDKTVFLEKGFNFSLSLIHPDDVQKLRAIHREIFDYYYSIGAEQRTDLRFSYNFRVKTASGFYVSILRQSSFTDFSEDGKPRLEYINSTDITGFRQNQRINLAVHRLTEAGMYALCYEHEFAETHPLLSERERQVLELAKKGLTTKEIAVKLYLSIDTIKTHKKNIFAKTGAGNIVTAINLLSKMG